MQQVFHTWIWGSSATPCRSSPVLSGWMVNVGGQPFVGLSRDAQLGLSQGSGWAIQEQSELLWSHSFVSFSCVLRVIVCWKCKPSAQSEVREHSGRRFSSRISLYLAAFIFPSIANQSSCPCSEQTTPTAWCCHTILHVGTVLDRVMSSAWFLHTYSLELRPKSYILVSSDQRILFVTICGVLQVFFSKLHAGFHVSCTEERLPSGHSAIKPPTGWRAAVMVTFLQLSPIPECISGAQPQWSWVLL